MRISFADTDLERQANDSKLIKRMQGEQRAKLLRRRLDSLHAADCLEDLRNAPGRCHELRENRAGQLSIDLDGPYRLIFEPAEAPVPTKPDGGLDWKRITAIMIVEIANTHGK